MRTIEILQEILQKVLLGYMRNFPVDVGKNILTRYINFDKIPNPYIYKSRDSIRYELYLDDYVCRYIYMFDKYERNTLRHLLPLIKPDMTFVDVGANIGAYSLILSKYLSRGKVFAFEPLSINYERLLRNIQLSNVTNIFPNKLGVLGKKGIAKIYYRLDLTGLSSASISQKEHLTPIAQKEETIELTDLDSYCIENNIDRIDILKIDIDGGESLALKGASKIIKNSSKMILIIELMDVNLKRMGSSAQELFRQIKDFGFTTYLPSAFPFRHKKISSPPPDNYLDNLICIKNR